jgi:lactate dehydrogenase-like 2-hydroxyacid dehydrogenase
MRELPVPGLVAIIGVGFDKVDLSLSASRGVAVSNTPDVLTESIADLAGGLVIAGKGGIAVSNSFVRSGSGPTATNRLGARYWAAALGSSD